jgi:6-phosphogluconolactonase (cycloisomerase 2 family)
MRSFDQWLTAAVCCGACALAGCARTGANASLAPTAPIIPVPSIPATKAKFVYTGNQGFSLSGYSVNTSTGSLTVLSGFPLALSGDTQVVAVDPQNRFLFVGDTAFSVLHVFAINDSTGALSQIRESPYATVHEPVAIAVDPSGTHVYVASLGSNSVGGYSVNTRGELTPIAGSPFATSGTKEFGFDVVINAAGTFVYVEDISNIYTYRVNAASGALTLLQTIAGPFQGSTIALDPHGTYFYAVGSGSNSIRAYAINRSSGLLTSASTSPMVKQNGAYTISISPTGRFAYTIENNNDLVSYALKDGVFTPIGRSYSHIFGQRIGVDPSGRFLYVPQACGNCSGAAFNVVNEFSIDGSGALTEIPGSPVAAGTTPLGIAITTQNSPRRSWWRRSWSAFRRWNLRHGS